MLLPLFSLWAFAHESPELPAQRTQDNERCAYKTLQTADGPIHYIEDRETGNCFYLPELELKNRKLELILHENSGNNLWAEAQATFSLAATEKSQKDWRTLQSSLEHIENVLGKEEFRLNSLLASRSSQVLKVLRRDGDQVAVEIPLQRAGAAELAFDGEPAMPHIFYPSVCGGTRAQLAETSTTGKVGFFKTSIDSFVSFYSPEVTKQMDAYRREFHSTLSPYERWRATYDAIRLLLDNPTERDKRIIKEFHVDPNAMAHTLANELSKPPYFGNPIKSLYMDTLEVGDLIIDQKRQYQIPLLANQQRDKDQGHYVLQFRADEDYRSGATGELTLAQAKELVKQGRASLRTERENEALDAVLWEDSPAVTQSTFTRGFNEVEFRKFQPTGVSAVYEQPAKIPGSSNVRNARREKNQ